MSYAADAPDLVRLLRSVPDTLEEAVVRDSWRTRARTKDPRSTVAPGVIRIACVMG
jgi:hypothetical protein